MAAGLPVKIIQSVVSISLVVSPAAAMFPEKRAVAGAELGSKTITINRWKFETGHWHCMLLDYLS